MDMETTKRKLMTGAAVAGLALAISACSSTNKASTASAGSDVTGECHGINSCKGTGECGGKGHSCAGKNSCKGAGWLKLSKRQCDAKGGTFKEG